MTATLSYFFSREFLVQVMAFLGFFSPVVLFIFLIAALITAFTRSPLPAGERFPSRREKIAFGWGVFLIPFATLMVFDTYFGFVLFGLITPMLCVFLTAIAGRRPFLYSLLFGSLYFASYTIGQVLFYGPEYLNRLLTTLRNDFLIPSIMVALGGALIAGLCLFLLWRCMDRNPQRWQAQPVE